MPSSMTRTMPSTVREASPIMDEQHSRSTASKLSSPPSSKAPVMKVSLHRKTPSLGQYQSTSIDKHFALSKQILVAFEEHYCLENPKAKTVAFFLGVNFLETVFLQIPLHGYYYSVKAAENRRSATQHAIDVLNKLESLIIQYPTSLSRERNRVVKLKFLAERLQSLEPAPDRTRYEPHRAATEYELDVLYPPTATKRRQSSNSSSTGRHHQRHRRSRNENHGTSKPSLSSSLADCDVLACGESLSAIFCPATYGTTSASSSSLAPTTITMNASDAAAADDAVVNDDNANDNLFPPHNHPQCQQESGFGTHSLQRHEQHLDAGSSFPPDGRSPPRYGDLFPRHISSMNSQGLHNDKNTSIGSVETGIPFLVSRHNDDRNVIHGIQTGVPLHGGHQQACVNKRMAVDPPAGRRSILSSSQYASLDHKKDLQRALYLSGLEVMSNYDSFLMNDDDDDRSRERDFYDCSDDEIYFDRSTPKSILRQQEINLSTAEERDASPVESEHFQAGHNFSRRHSGNWTASEADKERQANTGVSLDLLKQCYKEDFDTLLGDRRVIISEIPTYQGRVEGSMNGCTIIAPLMCIHHFHSDEKIVQGQHTDDGLSSEEIVDIIDKEVPSILPTIRQQLGLVPDAFLIPVDANDALMDQQLLCSQNFCNVFGGNILDDKHTDPFLQQMSSVGSKKLAATLFFHEHVVSILQLRQPSGVYFDFIDSLPHLAALLGTTDSRPQSEESLSSLASSRSSSMIIGSPHEREDYQLLSEHSKLMERSPLTSRNMISAGTAGGLFTAESSGKGGDWDDSELQRALIESCKVESSASRNAIRIRCFDVDALKATIKWYACNAFSVENATYIDTYQWDEGQCDFDPRVFQAFVWRAI